MWYYSIATLIHITKMPSDGHQRSKGKVFILPRPLWPRPLLCVVDRTWLATGFTVDFVCFCQHCWQIAEESQFCWKTSGHCGPCQGCQHHTDRHNNIWVSTVWHGTISSVWSQMLVDSGGTESLPCMLQSPDVSGESEHISINFLPLPLHYFFFCTSGLCPVFKRGTQSFQTILTMLIMHVLTVLLFKYLHVGKARPLHQNMQMKSTRNCCHMTCNWRPVMTQLTDLQRKPVTGQMTAMSQLVIMPETTKQWQQQVRRPHRVLLSLCSQDLSWYMLFIWLVIQTLSGGLMCHSVVLLSYRCPPKIYSLVSATECQLPGRHWCFWRWRWWHHGSWYSTQQKGEHECEFCTQLFRAECATRWEDSVVSRAELGGKA